MSSIIRRPGESWHDFQRRLAERDGLHPDRAVDPATNGPRFPGETETAWKARLARHDRAAAQAEAAYQRFAATLQPKVEGDTDADDAKNDS